MKDSERLPERTVGPAATPKSAAPEGCPWIDYLPDNLEEALAEAPVMSAPCVACPYMPGTEASTHPVTSRLARECAEARSSFWCHLTRGASLGGEFATHLCAGWLTDAREHSSPLRNAEADPGETQ